MIRCQELPGDVGRYGRRWLISIPADACLEGRAGLCPRILVSADGSEFVSEFVTATNVTGTADGDDELRAELVSEGDSLSGTGAIVTSSRWIEGWRGYEQQVVSVAVTNGSISGTFQLRYGDQATAPLDVNASAEAVEVRIYDCCRLRKDLGCQQMSAVPHCYRGVHSNLWYSLAAE